MLVYAAEGVELEDEKFCVKNTNTGELVGAGFIA